MASFDFKKPGNFYDELLGGSAENIAKSKEEIGVEYLIEIKDQPFNPYSSEQLKLLCEDIKVNGLMSPLIVHKMQDSTYEILAGRNRFNACKKLGMTTIPCIVKDSLNKAQCDLIMVNSNLMQRQSLLPSERARAYKMQQDAYKELGIKINTDGSQATLYKYLRLNNLCCELLDKVDKGEIPFTIGYELSGLDLRTQNALVDYLYDKPKTKLTAGLLGALGDIEETEEITENIIEDIVAKNKSAKNNENVKQLKISIKMDEFRSPLKSLQINNLKNFLLMHEFEIWDMYRQEDSQQDAE